jgi:K+ transporter
MPALTVAAIGVVFGDIGTSPLYALKEIFNGHHPIEVSPANILGILSLIFWSIMALVTLKYVPSSCAPTTAARAARWPCCRWSPSAPPTRA